MDAARPWLRHPAPLQTHPNHEGGKERRYASGKAKGEEERNNHLSGAKLAIPGIAEAREDIAMFIEVAIKRREIDRHIGMRLA